MSLQQLVPTLFFCIGLQQFLTLQRQRAMSNDPKTDRELTGRTTVKVERDNNMNNIQGIISENNGSTLLMLTPAMLNEFAQSLIQQAAEKLKKQEEQIFTPKEFAARHHVDVSTLWRWVKNGTLKKTTIAGKVYYKDSNLKIKED